MEYTAQDYGYMLVTLGTFGIAFSVLGFVLVGIRAVFRTLIEYHQAKVAPTPVAPVKRSAPQRTRYVPRHAPAPTRIDREALAADRARLREDRERLSEDLDKIYRDRFGADPWRWTAATEIRP